MTRLSTHVLDVGAGKPGAGVEVTLEREDNTQWLPLHTAHTDADGRVADLGTALGSGTYRVTFDTGTYGNSLFSKVQIVVTLFDDQDHYHIPLLLSPFGFTTYRGS